MYMGDCPGVMMNQQEWGEGNKRILRDEEGGSTLHIPI
jgi:hypothetical protein